MRNLPRSPFILILGALLAAVAVIFLALPLIAIVARALADQAWQGTPAGEVAQALALSLWTTVATVALAILFGTPLAYALARGRFRFRRSLSTLVELPIVLPPAVAGLALLMAFGRRGLLGPVLEQADIALPFTTAAVILAQTFVAAPLYVRAAQVGFEGVPRDLEDAARVDGASEQRVLWHVTLPLTARSLAAGLTLCWARAMGEFGATILFAGSLPGRTQTMPLLIYGALERDLDAAVWTGVVLIVLALAALLVSRRLQTLNAS
ncbi:MAG: molybdate ABC transporter permease subunit [Anaerolineae bacterium]|nr:molybdate ABC transporter permease subunit [Anaerolineae bacterium]